MKDPKTLDLPHGPCEFKLHEGHFKGQKCQICHEICAIVKFYYVRDKPFKLEAGMYEGETFQISTVGGSSGQRYSKILTPTQILTDPFTAVIAATWILEKYIPNSTVEIFLAGICDNRGIKMSRVYERDTKPIPSFHDLVNQIYGIINQHHNFVFINSPTIVFVDGKMRIALGPSSYGNLNGYTVRSEEDERLPDIIVLGNTESYIFKCSPERYSKGIRGWEAEMSFYELINGLRPFYPVEVSLFYSQNIKILPGRIYIKYPSLAIKEL